MLGSAEPEIGCEAFAFGFRGIHRALEVNEMTGAGHDHTLCVRYPRLNRAAVRMHIRHV